MTSDPPYDQDETQPYSREPQDGQAWPTYEQPTPAAEPPSPSGQGPQTDAPGAPAGPPPPPPYGQPNYQQPTYQQAPYGPHAPGYGYAPAGYAQPHSRATTSMVLGIIAVVGLVTGPVVCCVTLPGVLAAPFAIWTGLSARREIDLNPAAYNNRGQAVAGYVMGIVTCVLGVVALVAVVGLFAATSFTFGP